MSRAEDWRGRGGYFTWPPDAEGVPPVEIFHVELGDPAAPVLLLVHGWPTSSIDWFEVAGQLSARFRVCALDFPGYGFSGKPAGWGYSLARDAELLEFYLADVIGTEAAVVVAHDRGDSVALLHAARCADGRSATRIEHLVLSNGNIFLPLSNLTAAQRHILDPQSWPLIAAALTPAALAAGMGATTFTPPRAAGDPDVAAMTAIFSHDNGIAVLHETIQYLVERSQDEQAWLAGLARAEFPVTLIWGLCDAVSPPRVASYVWTEHLMLKPGANRLYFIPDANHYLQVDRPDAVVRTLLHTLGQAGGQPPGGPEGPPPGGPERPPPGGPERPPPGGPEGPLPGPLDAAPGAPLLVDSSRARLPDAADLLRPPGAA